jgi:hypothetical protein
LQDPPKVFGLKTNHLASLVVFRVGT